MGDYESNPNTLETKINKYRFAIMRPNDASRYEGLLDDWIDKLHLDVQTFKKALLERMPANARICNESDYHLLEIYAPSAARAMQQAKQFKDAYRGVAAELLSAKKNITKAAAMALVPPLVLEPKFSEVDKMFHKRRN